MTKEEIYKASDVLNTILDNYLHGGEAAEVVTKFEDELIKSNLTKEEPVSEDLEEEIDNYVKMNGYDGLDSIEEVKYIANHFAKWQKEQMMKEAKEAQVILTRITNATLAPSLSSVILDDSFKEGDKVKVIVIKDG